MALGRYAIGEGMTLSLAARADQRSLFAGLTSIVQRTVFFALAAAAPHASSVSRLSRARLAAAPIPSQPPGDARCITDRNRVVEGKRVSGRVDIGGRRLDKKTK